MSHLPAPFIHESAYVDDGARIGNGTKIWHFCHVMPGAVIGERCNLGQNVVVMNGVRLGNNVDAWKCAGQVAQTGACQWIGVPITIASTDLSSRQRRRSATNGGRALPEPSMILKAPSTTFWSTSQTYATLTSD